MTEQLKKQRSLVFLNYQNLPSIELSRLREQLKDGGFFLKAVKKTLLSKSLRRAGFNDAADKVAGFAGSIAVGVNSTDSLTEILAISWKFASSLRKPGLIAGGLLENQMLDPEEVKNLAMLPSAEQLRAQVVGAIASPLRGLVGSLNGVAASFINVLNAKLKAS